MSVTEIFEPVFVEFVPREMEEGKLYVSMIYSTTAHLCASGCGEKIVLPLHPAQWRMTFDGVSVSLSPSVGNWNLACESHYWIRVNRVVWAPKWDDWRISAGRERDSRELDNYFDAPQLSSLKRPNFRERTKRLFGR